MADNNHIHHYGIFQRTYAAGIGVNGCGHIVSNNCIHDAPHNAVLYGGNDHRFERNEVYRVVMETGDAGAFYTGRDWTSQGNVLRNNYIHDLGGGDAHHVNTMGMYFDDCDCGDTIVGNVFYRAGRAIMIGGGRDNPVLNNLVVDCPIGLHIDARGMTWKQWNNPADKSWCLEEKAKQLHYTQPPWSTRYPRLANIMNDSPREPLGNTVRRNVFVDCGRQVCDFDGNVQKLLDKLDIADNLAVNTTGAAKGVAPAVTFKGFKNLAGTRDKPIDLSVDALTPQAFAGRWNAWIQRAIPSFEAIPFDKIGLYTRRLSNDVAHPIALADRPPLQPGFRLGGGAQPLGTPDMGVPSESQRPIHATFWLHKSYGDFTALRSGCLVTYGLPTPLLMIGPTRYRRDTVARLLPTN